MASIFISHSSRDTNVATRLHEWLQSQGYDDIFLDSDKDAGVRPGWNWKGELHAAMKRAHVVLLLVSDAWFASGWSQAEYQTAIINGKAVIPLLVSAAEGVQVQALQHELQARVGDVQFVD